MTQKEVNESANEFILGWDKAEERIIILINELKSKFPETEVSKYSEGYANGWNAIANILNHKIKGEKNK